MSEPFYDPSERPDDDLTREEFESALSDDDLDEDSPLWLVNEQIKGLLEGEGATEDHDSVIKFLIDAGLPRGTAKRVHRAIVCGDSKELLPSASALAIREVIAERARQNAKWGEQNHDPITWSVILTEECGEFAQAALHHRFGGHAAAGLRDEAIQCAAVATQIVECIDRNQTGKDPA